MRLHLAALFALVGCSSNPSPLDSVHGEAKDPWATGPVLGTGAAGHDDDKSPLGGVDLKGMLAKLKDNVKKPGPYEAPEKSADYDEAKPHWGVIAIGGGVVEKTAFSFRGGKGTELADMVGRLRALATDAKVSGLLLRFAGLEISLPDLVELRVAMHDFRAAGKPIVCFGETAMNATYLMMTACDRIGLAPLGEVAIAGPSAMPIHIKPLLDKFGVTADFLHVGAYKGAAEPLTRDAPSKEMEEALGAILDGRYATMVDIVATERKLSPAAVKALIDTGLFPSERAKTEKLVDEVSSFEAFREANVKGPWTELKLKTERSDFEDLAAIMRFVGMTPPDRPSADHVAVVYAIGDIVDGDGDGVLGARQQIASGTLVATLRVLTADPSVKAVVLRVDSGGGSAQASELIWRAMADLKAKKPIVVSMSDVAASGGYYIASGATKIFAMPDTLTGSIGVVGGKLSIGPALAKLGVNSYPMGRGKHATMMASMRPWTDDEKLTIQTTMQEVYTVFIGRVAAGRGKTPAQIEPIAQGRVWTGTDALHNGLVDELGGMDAALAEARKLGHIDAKAELEVYPNTPTLRDILAGYGVVHAPLGVSALAALGAAALAPEASSLLAGLDPVIAEAIDHLAHLAVSFTKTQIQTVAVLPVML